MLEYLLVLLVVFLGAISFYLLYERFLKKTESAGSELYIRALKDLLDGNDESAFTKLRQVVNEDPSNIDAYLRLGEILRKHNKADRALQVHKTLTLRSGLGRQDKLDILNQLSRDYLKMEDFQTAEDALQEMIAIDSDNYWAHVNLIKIQEKNRNWDEAFETAEKILKLESNKSKKPLAQFKLKKGEELYRKREYHKARVVLKEAIGLDPACVEAYLIIGDAYYDEKRFEDAVGFWKKLIAAVPNEGHQVIDRLKKTLFELGRFGDLMEICENILHHDPKNIGARRTLAEFHEKKGDLEMSREILENVLEDYPDDTLTLLELIRIHLERGDQKGLKALLRNMESRRSKKSYSLTNTGSPTVNM